MNKHHLLLLLLHVCCSLQMWGNIDYISEALDLSQVANGTSTEVVIRAAGNDASDQSYGFVYYNGSTRFKIDKNAQTKDALKGKSDFNAYTFVLEKTNDGQIRIRENVTNGYIPYYSGTSSGGFSSIGANDSRAGYFTYTSATTVINTLDTNPAYILTSTQTDGLPVRKANNEFQVGGSSVQLGLQFFRYASADKYSKLPALYPSETISTLRTALVAATCDTEVDAAIEELKSSANGRLLAFSSTGRGGNDNPHYIYRLSDANLGTAVFATAAPTAIFQLEYISGQGYKIRNVSATNNNYIGKTGNNNARVGNTNTDNAGLYAIEEVVAIDNAYSIRCLNGSGPNYCLHEQGGGTYLVPWEPGAANCTASIWNLSTAGCITIQATDNQGQNIQAAYTHYFIGNEVTVTAPVIEHYVANTGAQTAHHGDIVTFAYSLKSYDITYTYTDAETKQVISSTTVQLAYGTDLPEVVAPSGYQVLTQIEGSVEGDCNYTIVCLNLNSTDHPDPVAPEKPAKVNLTYQFVGPDGAVWYEKEMGEVNNGEAYPAHGVTLPTGVTVTQPTGTLNTMESTLTVKIPCSTTLKLKFADTYAAIDQWYYMTIGDNPVCALKYEQTDTQYMSLETSNGTDDKYCFAFVGNPIDGFKIYNKATRETMLLSAPQPRTTNKNGGEDYVMMRSTSVAGTDGYNTAWDFTPYGDGYLLSRHGETYYVNNRDSRLAFWTANKDGGSRIRVVNPDVVLTTTNPATATPTAGKVYRIYNVLHPGRMIMEDANHNLMKTNEKMEGELSQLWILDNSTTQGTFTLRNANSGRFIVAPTGNNAQAVTQTTASPLYFIYKSGNNSSQNKPYYGIGGNADGSGNVWLNTNTVKTQIAGWSLSEDVGSGWVLEETEEVSLDEVKAHVKANEPYASLTSDKYYRLVNKLYPTRHMVENYAADHNVRGLEDNAVANLNSQIWRIEGSDENGYTLQNAFTGNYIQYPTSGKQFTTTTEQSAAKKFLVTTTGGSDWSSPAYAFYHSSDNKNSLHCENTWNIVTWTYENAQASFWYLEPVELSSEQIATIHAEYETYLQEKEEIADVNANSASINATLATIFTDASCSELNDTYKALSDYRIGLAFDAMGLPEAVKEMAIRVKHQTWEMGKDATYNKYVRDFRIADYEPYSDCSVWNNITKVGPFGCATNPTGITVKSGDVLYVYVGDDVKDNEAELMLELVDDTNRSGTRSQALRKGLNTYQAPHNGEVFVFYNVTNPAKYVYAAKGHEADYPNIRVHIEGGQVTGMWDMHRGMTDEQWDWLCDNMFTAPFIHIKGHNTVLSGLTSEAVGPHRMTDVMKIWDYIFMTEERLIGHDGQWDGRYKPVMTARRQYSGNPNWGGGSINLGGLNLDFESLMNERWVIYHEEAHGHQYPINLAATTESSNNGFAQMVNHEFGLSSRRGNGVKTLIDFKNNGWGWVDMLRGGEGTSRTEGFKYYDDCVWAQNHLFYQLYLYFHAAGNMPDFWPRLCDEMRRNGGLIQHGGNANPPTYYYNDYLKFAEACAKVSETDLFEFFDTWGFFGYCEDVKVGNDFTKGTAFREKDDVENGIRFVGDYGSYYLRMPMKGNEEDEKRLSDLKAFMKSQPKKAPNIMFIDDHILDRNVSPDCFAAQLDPSRIGQPVAFYSWTGRQGDYGDFAQFTGTNEACNLDYSISDNTITVSGEGMVGVKIYDENGNLIRIYNTYTITLDPEKDADIATKLTNGTYTLVAALGNDTNLPLAKPSVTKYKMAVYNGNAADTQTYQVSGETVNANIPYSATTTGTDVPNLTGNAVALYRDVDSYFSLPRGLKGVNVFTNTKAGTAEAPEWNTMTMQFTDKADFYLPKDGTFTAGVVNYPRTNTAGLNSVCLPFAINKADTGLPSGSKIYTLSNIGDTSISFSEVDEVAAGEFCIIDCPSESTWSLGGTEITLIGTPIEDDAQGSFQNKTIGEGMYKLNNAGTKFGITTSAGMVTAFRGYLNLPASGGVRQFALSLEDAPIVTGVDEVQTLQPTYATDLQGRTTLTLQRGKTYIINGKKTLAR